MALELLTATGAVIIADLFAYREYLRYKYALERQKQTQETTITTTRNNITLLTSIDEQINEPLQTSQQTQENTPIQITPDRIETIFIPDYSALAQIQKLRNENSKLKAQLQLNPNWEKILNTEIEKTTQKIQLLEKQITQTKTKLGE